MAVAVGRSRDVSADETTYTDESNATSGHLRIKSEAVSKDRLVVVVCKEAFGLKELRKFCSQQREKNAQICGRNSNPFEGSKQGCT